MFLLGIDYGTGGCKVTVLDETGRLVGEASTEFVTHHDHPGWSEQEPGDWWDALCESLKKLAAKGVDLSEVAALALDGSTHNAVLLGDGAFRRNAPTGDAYPRGCGSPNCTDANPRGCSSPNCTDANPRGCSSPNCTLQPLRRTIMWTDQRATEECEWLRTARRPDGTTWAEYLFKTCYQMPAPTWTLPQLMWLKHHEPEVLEKVEKVLFVKDYIRYLLTGDAATDYIEAQGTLMWNISAESAFRRNAPTEDGGCISAESAFRRNAPTEDPSGCNSPNCTDGWDQDLVALAGLKMSAMPRIIRPTDVVGTVTAEAAAATSLPVGCKVVCGTSDSAVEDYGAGAVEPGDLIIKLATAGNVNAMTANAHPHPKTLTYSHVVPGLWYSVSATNAAALCMRWMRDTFYGAFRRNAPTGERTLLSVRASGGNAPTGERTLLSVRASGGNAPTGERTLLSVRASGGNAPTGERTLLSVRASGGNAPTGASSSRGCSSPNCTETSPNLYSLMDAEAFASSVGANGVMFHPYLQGERCPYWDANLRASFTGVSISSTRGDFCRALMEGVAFSLRDCYRTLEEMQLPVKRIFLIGGGSRSKLWSEIVANVFNVEVAVPTPADASFGSCLLAGVGIGLWPDAKTAVAKCLRIDRTIMPDPSAAATYAQLFKRYRAIHDALAGVSADVSQAK